MNVATPVIAKAPGRIASLALLDDAQFDHAALRRSATRTDFVESTVSLYSAEDALDYIGHPDRPPIDVFLVDLQMPRTDGLEFLSVATDRFGPGFAQLIYLALTLEPDKDLNEDMQSLGCLTGWVEKPVTPSTLLRISTDLHLARQT
ncbi:MAG: hypothetical protein AAFW64_02545 [Pseudomonadota bacterium]